MVYGKGSRLTPPQGMTQRPNASVHSSCASSWTPLPSSSPLKAASQDPFPKAPSSRPLSERPAQAGGLHRSITNGVATDPVIGTIVQICQKAELAIAHLSREGRETLLSETPEPARAPVEAYLRACLASLSPHLLEEGSSHDA